MALSIKQRLARLPAAEREAWIAAQPPEVVAEMAREEWWYTARPEQIPPLGSWLVCLYLAGRGAGKSRSGSEYMVDRVLAHPYDRQGVGTEWGVIAETLSDARLICLEGPSGILNVLSRRGIPHRYKQSPKPMILIGDSKIHTLGADDADVGRGHNFAGVWLDEICKWLNPDGAWLEGIMPALRADLGVGDHPRAFVTTTPKPIRLLKEWLERDDGSVHVITGSTYDNADNLSTQVLTELRKRYAGTALGEQELHGKLLDLKGGGLFRRMDIVGARVAEAPDLVSTVVGMDPNLTGEDAETGLIVVGRDARGDLFVLADRSVQASGRAAAHAAWRAVADYRADLLAYEENLGKRYLEETLRDSYAELVEMGVFPTGTTAPMKPIHAKHGKKTRAEPVGLRCEQGRLHMVGVFDILEDQMVLFDPETTRDSPDRMDALVHSCLQLMAGERRRMGISDPSQYQLDTGWYSLAQHL